VPLAPGGVQNAPGVTSENGAVVVDVVVAGEVEDGGTEDVVGGGVAARVSMRRAGVSPVKPVPVGNHPSTSTITSTVPEFA
jgi:hypothetical protein